MLDEFFWDTLLMHIESGQVVPIVGQGLLEVDQDGRKESLQRFLAGRLAEDFHIPAADLAPDCTVSDIFCHPRFPREKRTSAYARLKYHLDHAPLAPPEALRQLAQIRPLNLFISTTFDDLLSRALNTERFAGATRTRAVNYSPRDVRDLPPPEQRDRDVIVYHLFGQATSMPYFAVTEADYLEFFNALLGERTRVSNLTELLDQRDLLFLGTAFPDWLSRFLLRFAKRGPLSTQRDFTEVFADAPTRRDAHFTSFVGNFSQQTLVYEEGGAAEFVAELHRRWLEKHPESTPSTPPLPLEKTATAPGEAGAIFISYASEDFRAALHLRDQLTAAGATVWFDKKPDSTDDTLVPGDDYKRKIERNIRSCAVFMPVISRAVSTDKDRFFRFEWAMAINRLPYFTGLNRRFILPVVVDDTSPYATGVPDQFGLLHATRAREGVLTARDCASMVEASRATAKTATP
jgi:hypothetical protein